MAEAVVLNAKNKKILFDVGVIYSSSVPIDLETLDFKAIPTTMKLFGLTKGGVEFTAGMDVRDIEFDGSRERKIKGMQRIVGGSGSIKVTGLELGENQLLFNLMEKVTGGTKYTKFVPRKSGLLQDSDYRYLMYVGKASDGSSAIIIIKNGYSSEGFTLKAEDKNEASYEMNVEGTWELNDDLTDKDVPFEIYTSNNVSALG